MRLLRIHNTDANEQADLRKKMNSTEGYDVVITTYEMISLSGLQHAFRTILWRGVVLDEGHRIKNEKTDTAIACSKLKGQFKVILTGTPLQNNLHELGSLLNFLFPSIFTDLSLFDNGFQLNLKIRSSAAQNPQQNAPAAPSASSSTHIIDRDLLEKAHYLLRLFQLRRLKIEVEQNLPLKLETKIECPMTNLQKEITQFLLFQERNLIAKIEQKLQMKQYQQQQLGQQLEQGKDGTTTDPPAAPIPVPEKVTFSNNERASVMGLLAHLRKAANHPFLFPGIETPQYDGTATEEIVSSSGKMIILDKLLKQLKEKKHRVVLFSQFTKPLDIICDYLDLRGYKYGRLDGSTNRVMREVLINLFNKKDSDLDLFCLTTRAGGMGVNLCSADTVILFDSDWNPQVSCCIFHL
jgi:SWI/SNF-related matrix-associated actin-dependent regulator of chromatin subfamily A member 5